MIDRAAREAYLDGYRSGLGAAIQAIGVVRDRCAGNATLDAVLDGLATGLRICSASTVLADEDAQ